MSKEKPYKVLFVCMGNICRSPAAEGVFQHILNRENASHLIECDSAGTLGYHQGEPADSRMRSAAAARNIQLHSRARPLTADDFNHFDLILTMDEDNFNNSSKICPNEASLSKLKRFCDYLQHHSETEVPDPYYGGTQGFEKVLDLLEDGCEALYRELSQNYVG